MLSLKSFGYNKIYHVNVSKFLFMYTATNWKSQCHSPTLQKALRVYLCENIPIEYADTSPRWMYNNTAFNFTNVSVRINIHLLGLLNVFIMHRHVMRVRICNFVYTTRPIHISPLLNVLYLIETFTWIFINLVE